MFKSILRIKTISLLLIISISVWKPLLFLKISRPLIRTIFNYSSTINFRIGITSVAAIILVLIIIKIWNLILAIRRCKKQQATIAGLMPSDDRHQYIISRDDYRRGSPKESYYRKTFCLYLLEVFGNSCAKCGSKENGMDIDHFIFSKNEGGCFIMTHRDGYLINNAIPLCQTCNRSKSDDHYKSFFDESELLVILQKNVIMTGLLNKRTNFSDEGKLTKHKKVINT